MSKKAVKGIHLEIGGDTTGLTKALSDVNKKSRSVQAELREIDKALKLDPGNTDILAQKQKLLAQSVGNTKEKLQALKKAKAEVDKCMSNGDTSVSESQYRKLQREISNTTAQLKKLEKESKDAGDALKKGPSKKAFGSLNKILPTTAKAASNVTKGILAVGTSLFAVAKSTQEYREDLNKLNTAFASAGKDSESAKKAYSDFYGILGESDRAVEAVNHLAELTNTEEELTKWTKIAAGVNSKFTDSLPIEGLTEASNETAKVGKVTGVLADALNWVSRDSSAFKNALGGNESALDAFNKALKDGENVEDAFTAALSKMTTEEERASAITSTLDGIYSGIGETYLETNADIIAGRNAQQEWNDALARAGEMLDPLCDKVVSFGASLLSGVADIAEGIARIGDATADVKAINAELEEAKNNFKSAVDESEVASEKIESWKQLKEKMDDGTFSSAKLKEAQAKVKEIEQWFIDNYGSYISAEEEKNGIRDETIDKLGKEFDTMSEIAKLELQTELVKNVDKIPEIEYETELLKGKTQALQEQNQVLFDNKNKIALAQAEWNLFLASDSINDPAKTAEKVRELNATLEGTGVSIQDGNSASIQLDHALQRIGFRMEEVGEEISGNKTKIAEGEKTINTYKLGLETLAAVAPEVVDSFRVTREGVEGETEKQVIAMGGHFAQMQTDTEKAYSYVTSTMLEESAQQYDDTLTKYTEIGKNIPEGLKIGIEKGKARLEAGVKGFVTELKSWFTSKDALDEHSPSKWSEQVAAFVDDGLALGFIKNAEKVRRSMRELFGMMTEEREALTEDITQEEKRYNEELERIRKEGTEKQNKAYLEGLKELADEAKEKRDFIREQYGATVEDVKDAIADLEKEMESYQKGLSKSTLFREDKYTFNFGGQKTEHTVPVLADLSPKVQELEAFIKDINSLKEMGIDDVMLEQIQELGGEEGGMLAKALLNATPEMRDKFIADFKKIDELSGEATAEVFQKELVGAADELKKALDELAPDLLQTGETWGSYLGSGIMSKLRESLSSISGMTDYPILRGGGGAVSINTNIENHIQATPNTANEVAEAQRRQMEDIVNWGQIL